MQQDHYRPASTARFRAGLDSGGNLSGWDIKIVSPGFSGFIIDGLKGSAYAPADSRLEYVIKDVGVPVGAWRSIGNSSNAFYVESFVDELACAAARDPYLFRYRLLSHKPRHRAVLERAASMAEWNKPLPAGHFRGIAMHAMAGTVVAQVIEISVQKNKLHIQRVDCAVDCGIAINPDTITAQMEGSVVDGLAATLYGEITIKEGRVQQTNFDSYRMLRVP